MWWEFGDDGKLYFRSFMYTALNRRMDFGSLQAVGLWAFIALRDDSEYYNIIQFEDPRFRNGIMLSTTPDSVSMEHIRCEPCGEALCGEE